ncbi:MAG: hypothetical protein WCG27_12450 [Pseudomonadota bacterium]
MKNKILNIVFQSFDSFKTEVATALKNKKKLIQGKDEIFFDSIPSFRKFMTPQKLELLSAIVKCRPQSVYSLANLIDRDFAAVLRDCVSLEKTGFIVLEETKNSKNSKIPKLSFSYHIIAVHIPNAGYNIEFGAAA